MQFPNIRLILGVTFLLLAWSAAAQDKAREINIHKNVTLIERPIPADIPGDIAEQYKNFLPILEEVLTETTTDPVHNLKVSLL